MTTKMVKRNKMGFNQNNGEPFELQKGIKDVIKKIDSTYGMGTVYIAIHCFFKCGLITKEKQKTFIIQALTRTSGIIGKMKISSNGTDDEKVIQDEIKFFGTILDKAEKEDIISRSSRESFYDNEVYQHDQAAVIEIRDELELLKKELNERCQRIEDCLKKFGKIYRKDQKIKSFCAVIGGIISVLTLGSGGIFSSIIEATALGNGNQLLTDAFQMISDKAIVDFAASQASNHCDSQITALLTSDLNKSKEEEEEENEAIEGGKVVKQERVTPLPEAMNDLILAVIDNCDDIISLSEIIEKNSEDLSIQQAGCKQLGGISKILNSLDKKQIQNTTNLILYTMANHKGSHEIQYDSCIALYNMAFLNEAQFFSFIQSFEQQKVRIVEAVVSMMELHIDDSKIQHIGCDLFGLLMYQEHTLGSGNNNFTMTILNKGGKEVIVLGMEKWRTDLNYQRKGCSLLLTFLTRETESEQRGRKMSSIVIDARNFHPEDIDLKGYHYASLMHEIINDMSKNLDNFSIQHEGCRLLADISSKKEKFKFHFNEEKDQQNILSAIFGAMEKYKKRKAIQSFACKALLYLTIDPKFCAINDKETIRRLKSYLSFPIVVCPNDPIIQLYGHGLLMTLTAKELALNAKASKNVPEAEGTSNAIEALTKISSGYIDELRGDTPTALIQGIVDNMTNIEASNTKKTGKATSTKKSKKLVSLESDKMEQLQKTIDGCIALATTESSKKFESLSNDQVQAIISTLLTKLANHKDYEIQYCACKALYNLAFHCEANFFSIESEVKARKIVGAVVCAMRIKDARIQRLACDLFGLLMHGEQSLVISRCIYTETMLNSGGIKAIIGAMKQFKSDVGFQCSGCHTLLIFNRIEMKENLLKDDEDTKHNIQELLDWLKENHSQDERVQQLFNA